MRMPIIKLKETSCHMRLWMLIISRSAVWGSLHPSYLPAAPGVSGGQHGRLSAGSSCLVGGVRATWPLQLGSCNICLSDATQPS